MLSSLPSIFGIDPFSTGTTPVHPLGTKGVTADGRIFRYAKAGASAIATAKLCMAVDMVSNHEDRAFATAGAVGDTSVSIAIGATAVTANQYDEGYLAIVDDTGEGHLHKIVRHGISSAGSENVTFIISPGLEEATTTSTTVTLYPNLYKGVLITDADQANVPVGVTPVAVGASEYFWLQTGGIASVLTGTNGTTQGQGITIGLTNNGSVEVKNAIGEPHVGLATIGVTQPAGEHGLYLLQLDS